ncbi:MAG: excinuclease ABC subunit UvrA [Candidatus Omnitrophota bacterium]|nr:MAG: excinuclease ABC subunit UvrA [Candidatus Omnitrophota bacterium]HDN85857.1 excinuclease ABC subunit UvrA [Candidatus Omnitrophota bacterium]
MDTINIKGAKVHNLKNINLQIPKNKLVVITGVSGSGKSSLAFDTIYAEGQRRYVESLSSYARQFLEQFQKPDVESIEGLSPAIAIEQRTAGGSPRSIVATQTEIYDYLRLLFARVGRPYCHKCGRPITKETSSQIIEKVLSFPKDHRIFILSPVVRGKKGTYQALFNRLLREGFRRVRVDKKIYDLDEEIKIDRYKLHNIEIVVDRVVLSTTSKERITNSVETALKYGEGLLLIYDENKDTEYLFNTKFSCPHCGIYLSELEPRMFSFNSPYGACPSCNGLGTLLEFDPDLVIPDKKKSIREGAIEPWRRGSRGYILYYRSLLRELAEEVGFSLDTPFYKLPKKVKDIILYGDDNVWVWSKPFEGVIPYLERVFNETDSDYLKHELTKYMSKLPCPRCKGARLKKESLSVYLENKSIWDVVRLSIGECFEFISSLKLTPTEEKIAHHILKEIKKRLKFCIDVGLGYLTLDRLSSTLSGGESQRIRLATQVGSGLSGVIYILDEPTIGLHPRDGKKLIDTLKNLRDLGNTVIVVEHDEAMIRASDWIVDLGPGAGLFGGKVVYSGKVEGIFETSSLTGRYLSKREYIELPKKRRSYRDKPYIVIRGAREHNLKNIDVRIPLGVFVCVTGVSGSGKSTLVEEILYRALAKKLYDSREKPGLHTRIERMELIDKVIIVDQSPIGRTPRSNPATYTGVFTYIREVFAQLPEARARGYKPSRFSFNVVGGRCEACKGDGIKKIEMHFLPDVYIPCQVCRGKRFNAQTLEVKFKGKSIADVLEMSVDEAYDLFYNFPQIKNILQTLKDVGLGYIKMGQSATTLSGGEAQRIKLASQLRKKATGKTLYILDEPTTGLHFDDIKKLLNVLQRLVDRKNTVVVIEHNLDVIKCADYIIDLGPEGGEEGGYLVGCGSPEEIALIKASYTGKFLKEKLSFNFTRV